MIHLGYRADLAQRYNAAYAGLPVECDGRMAGTIVDVQPIGGLGGVRVRVTLDNGDNVPLTPHRDAARGDYHFPVGVSPDWS